MQDKAEAKVVQLEARAEAQRKAKQAADSAWRKAQRERELLRAQVSDVHSQPHVYRLLFAHSHLPLDFQRYRSGDFVLLISGQFSLLAKRGACDAGPSRTAKLCIRGSAGSSLDLIASLSRDLPQRLES